MFGEGLFLVILKNQNLKKLYPKRKPGKLHFPTLLTGFLTFAGQILVCLGQTLKFLGCFFLTTSTWSSQRVLISLCSRGFFYFLTTSA